MWIAKKVMQSTQIPLTAEQGTVTIGGETAGVLAGSETRGITLVQPGGFAWRPKSGDGVLVLKNGDGTAYLLGAIGVSPELDSEMGDGDVCLFSDGASICLHTDGKIDICGEVYINGVLLEER